MVMAGDAKVNNSKFKACFQQKAVMLPGTQVAARVGHEPGAVCPFALNAGAHVFLDESLKRFDVVYTAGGSLTYTVELTMEELVQLSAPAESVAQTPGLAALWGDVQKQPAAV